MSKPFVLGAAALLANGAGLATWLWGAPFFRSAEVAPTPPPPIPVVVQTVQTSDFPIVRTGIGTVVAFNTVDIRTQVTGTIEKIGFVEGETVHAGSLIAQLDPRPFQAALDQAKASLARDEAHLANANVNLKRYQLLVRQNSAPRQQLDDQSSAVAELAATIAGDNAAIANAGAQLSYTTIVSPIEGVTGIQRVDAGNLVQPTDSAPIVTIAQIQPISVIFNLPQKDVPAVQAAMAKGQLDAMVYSQDETRRLGSGKLQMVDNKIDQKSGTVQLKANFCNENRALWPGAFVAVRLVLELRREAISIPLAALRQGQGGSTVFVVGHDDAVSIRPVDIVETLDGRALVGQGLAAGEKVVVAGQYRLRNGVKIKEVSADDPHVQNLSAATQGMLP